MLTYDLHSRGELSLFEFLYRSIKNDILTGQLQPSERLPSKRTFARHLGISTITIEAAYRQLVAEGYVYARERSGYYVADVAPVSSPTLASALAYSPIGAEQPFSHASSLVSHEVAHYQNDSLHNRAQHEQYEQHGAHGQVEQYKQDKQYEQHILADFSRPASHAHRQAARLWERTLRSTFSHESEATLFREHTARGSMRLREAIAQYLLRSRGMHVEPEAIVIAAGAKLLYSLCALMNPRARTIALEDPGYPVLCQVYTAFGKRVQGISQDEHGLLVSELALKNVQIAHVMPSHQFPSGHLMSISRRYELLSWAYDGAREIIEDDFDWEFRLAGRPIPSLQSIDAQGKVIYISTFSVSLSPALRIAYAVFPDALNERVEHALACFSQTVSTIDQIALARALESGDYERHISRFRAYARRVRDELISALQSSPIGNRLIFGQVDNGLHFVLGVRTEAYARDIARVCRSSGVIMAPLDAYCLEQTTAHDGYARFVMQYSGVDPQHIHEAVLAFVRAVKECE
ncbi:GntR family transcriptional regulator [Galliscardovia ingluviei]|uniref:GntR family transcriptional regulator n=1 Tax=Galliscardovia ingluviei TaxID=1769422 RepID=A0A8J3AKN1_9BIFI|nr:PLP-dependent aminotransferase family protein [Galliscardovia ingluviei]GGI15610.1 GntR family transcriptional regulator [Galliscardovia ingluviei]